MSDPVRKLTMAMTAAGMRPVVGIMKGFDVLTAPLGTIVGPRDTTGEYLVVIGHTDAGAQLGYATTTDLSFAGVREPRSVAEVRYVAEARRRWAQFNDYLGQVDRVRRTR